MLRKHAKPWDYDFENLSCNVKDEATCLYQAMRLDLAFSVP